jgi:ABC-type nitrate/sulfonate/bicarbonate transport system substrate-binding protein
MDETARRSVSETRRSDSLHQVHVVVFAGASNWPMWVGQHQGFFADFGLDLHVTVTHSSKQMALDLHSGAAQIALTSVDNVIAYAAGIGENPLDGPADFFAFMGVDDGLLSIMAQPHIRTLEDLRGKVLAVDALTTGYVFVLKELLARSEINDVIYAAIGTGAERLKALAAGSCDATLLNAPLCLAAENAGKRRLVRARDVLARYQGVVGAARWHWAFHNAPVVESFIRGFHRSLVWLNDPSNKDAAMALLGDRMPAIRSVVSEAYDALVVGGGLRRDLQVDREGTDCVIRLREKFGKAIRLGEVDRYVDDRFRLAALT